MSDQLDHRQIELFSNALLDAFDPPSFGRMLYHKTGRRVHNVAPTNVDFPTTVFEAIMTSRREGWLAELILGAREANPGNPKLLEFSQPFGLASTDQALERLVDETSSFLDPGIFGAKLGEAEVRVCQLRIETNSGLVKGTGFLVASSLVFTNYHVMEAVIEGEQGRSTAEGLRARASDVTCLFDYRVMDGGLTNEGTPFRLASDWLVAASLNTPLDQPPAEDHLDYALIRLAGAPGNANVGKTEVGGLLRGFVSMPVADYPFPADSPLLIMQHPDGLPVKLAFESRSMIGLNANGTRVKYRTNTLAGSSGSPCFSQNWDLVALHHSGDPNFDPQHKPSYNEGIPFKAILEHLPSRAKTLLGT